MYEILRQVKAQNPQFYREFVDDLLHSSPCSPESYFYMRQLYVATRGQFNEEALQLYALFNSKQIDLPESGILVDAQASCPHQLIEAGLNSLQQDGIYQIPKQVNADRLSTIRDAIFQVPIFDETIGQAVLPQDLINRSGYRKPTYQIDIQELLKCPAAQELLLDESFLFLAQEQLGCNPVLCTVSSWFSFPIASHEPSLRERDLSGAAQKFHFDMDRVRFVNIFVYLNDVTPENGPFVYVKGSHCTKPPSLRDGRYEDWEMTNFYGDNNILDITGSAGSVFVADNFGFHKGKPLKSGYRFVFQLVYSVSLFGSEHQYQKIPTSGYQSSFVNRLKDRSNCFSGRFQLDSA
jgi:hypothetical protein